MHFTIQNTYVCIVCLSFLASLLSFKYRYSVHLKLFSGLLGITTLVEILSVFIVVPVLHRKTNSDIYNVFMGIEFECYAFFYYQIIIIPWIRKLIKIFLYVFPFFWAVSVFFIVGLKHWNNYLVITGGASSVLFSLAYYYQILKSQKDIVLFSHAEFWIATGMLIFYSSQVPYFGMLNYLVKKNLLLARSLLPVLQVVDAVMYLFFIYAFICPIIPQTQKKSQ